MIVGNVMAIRQCALLPFRSLFRTAEVKTAGNSRHSGHLRQTRYQPGQERESSLEPAASTTPGEELALECKPLYFTVEVGGGGIFGKMEGLWSRAFRLVYAGLGGMGLLVGGNLPSRPVTTRFRIVRCR